MSKKRTSIYLDEVDHQAIEKIKKQYGITSDSDAIRFALRIVTSEEGKDAVQRQAGQHRPDGPTR